MKKILCVALCGMALLFPSFSMAEQKPQNSTMREQGAAMLTGNVQMANPFEDFATLKEAETRAGFSITLPINLPEGYAATQYRALITGSKLLEVIYKNNEHEICFRKGQGEKISGVYGTFAQTYTLTINETTVVFSGKEDKIQLAEWKKDDFSYSISATTYDEKTFTTGGGITKEAMTSLVQSMLQ